MDTGTILGFTFGYLAAIAGIFILYSPIIILCIGVLIAGGLLQLLLLPFAALIRRLRRRPPPETDPSWLLDRSRQGEVNVRRVDGRRADGRRADGTGPAGPVPQ